MGAVSDWVCCWKLCCPQDVVVAFVACRTNERSTARLVFSLFVLFFFFFFLCAFVAETVEEEAFWKEAGGEEANRKEAIGKEAERKAQAQGQGSQLEEAGLRAEEKQRGKEGRVVVYIFNLRLTF